MPHTPSRLLFSSTLTNISQLSKRSPQPHLRLLLSQTHRNMSSSSSSQHPLPPLTISSNSDPSTITAALPSLLHPAGRWALTPQHSGVQRSFKFKTFKQTWAFMDAVAAEAAKARHHPEWSNVYNTTFIRWTTHHPRGLSELDLKMATICDARAAEHNELPAEQPESPLSTDSATSKATDPLTALADDVATAGGECCVPKSARKGAGGGGGGDGVVDENLHEKGP